MEAEAGLQCETETAAQADARRGTLERRRQELADRFARLEARGIALRRGAGNLAELPPPVKVKLDRPLSEVLEELREDRI
jgi:hypothetical protein